MPNRSSKAGHIPERSCVICKNKTRQDKLMRFAIIDREIVFDMGKILACRGYYVCNNNECLLKLEKWLSKHLKKTKRVEDGK